MNEDQSDNTTKENFVSIYGRAHQKTLTPELIHSAFRALTDLPCTPGPSSQLPIDPNDPFITPEFLQSMIQSGVQPSWRIAVNDTMDSLASTSASVLADNTPLTCHDHDLLQPSSTHSRVLSIIPEPTSSILKPYTHSRLRTPVPDHA